MIKFKAHKGSKEMIGFGITEGNIKLLKKGKSIYIDDPDFSEKEFMIFYGETEEKLAKMFEDRGMIGPNTKFKINKEKY